MENKVRTQKLAAKTCDARIKTLSVPLSELYTAILCSFGNSMSRIGSKIDRSHQRWLLFITETIGSDEFTSDPRLD